MIFANSYRCTTSMLNTFKKSWISDRPLTMGARGLMNPLGDPIFGREGKNQDHLGSYIDLLCEPVVAGLLVDLLWPCCLHHIASQGPHVAMPPLDLLWLCIPQTSYVWASLRPVSRTSCGLDLLWLEPPVAQTCCGSDLTQEVRGRQNVSRISLAF